MQDRYAGDVGDYIKLGLLRALSPERQLGIAWYRFLDESHNGDGRHISYLDQPQKYAALDPALFEHLKGVTQTSRTISSLLPMLPNALSHDEALDVTSVLPRQRRTWRKAWFSGLLDRLASSDIVFADPDNGIVDNADWRKGSAKFGKQMPLDEVRSLARGRCAIIYHHNTRRVGGHDVEVDHWLDEIGIPGMAVRATAFSPRTFFILNPDQTTSQRVYDFCNRWSAMKVRLHS